MVWLKYRESILENGINVVNWIYLHSHILALTSYWWRILPCLFEFAHISTLANKMWTGVTHTILSLGLKRPLVSTCPFVLLPKPWEELPLHNCHLSFWAPKWTHLAQSTFKKRAPQRSPAGPRAWSRASQAKPSPDQWSSLIGLWEKVVVVLSREVWGWFTTQHCWSNSP